MRMPLVRVRVDPQGTTPALIIRWTCAIPPGRDLTCCLPKPAWFEPTEGPESPTVMSQVHAYRQHCAAAAVVNICVIQRVHLF